VGENEAKIGLRGETYKATGLRAAKKKRFHKAEGHAEDGVGVKDREKLRQGKEGGKSLTERSSVNHINESRNTDQNLSGPSAGD